MKTFLRRLEILNYLHRGSQAASTEEVLAHLLDAGYLESDQRERRSQFRIVQRDLNFLLGKLGEEDEPDNDFGLSVERGLGKSQLWSLEPYQHLNYDFERMPAYMALALSLSAKHLTQVLPSATQKELQRVFDNAANKLRQSENKLSRTHYQRLTNAVEFFQRGQSLQAPDFDIQILDTIYRAILLGKRILIHYQGAQGEKSYDLHPYGVAIMLPKLYLVAKKDEDMHTGSQSGFRSFLVHKITHIEVSRLANHVPEEFVLKDYLLQGSMNVLIDVADKEFYNIEVALKVADNTNLLSDLRESPLNLTQQLSKIRNGEWLLSAKVQRTIQLRNWLLSLGGVARIQQPDIIKQDLINTLDAIKQNYI